MSACENSGTYVPMLSPPFISVMIETLNMLLIPAILDVSGSASIDGRRSNNLQTPSRRGTKPNEADDDDCCESDELAENDPGGSHHRSTRCLGKEGDQHEHVVNIGD